MRRSGSWGCRKAMGISTGWLVPMMAVVWVVAAWGMASAEEAAPPPPDPTASAASEGAGVGPTGGSQAAPEAQTPADQATRLEEAQRKAEAALAAETAEPSPPRRSAAPETPQLNALDLALKGGVLMIPITGMSILTVLFGVERLLGLRRRKVLPAELTDGLRRLAGQRTGFDPRQAYRLVQHYPSAGANVVRAMLLKVGRPLTEVEQAIAEAKEREADRLYSNVRFLSLAAGITPLLGLLGTVQGMIQAFFVTAHLPTGVNKAESLAQGIYVALVTTFAGLCVAIPASIMAHYFEGRIQKLLRELDEILLVLLPQLERFEGRLRVSPEQLEQTAPEPARPASSEEARKAPFPAVTK